MKDVKLENCKLPISRLVLGTSTAPCCRGENCDEVFNAALRLGITTFDTARIYGKSEETIGGWMERTNSRERVNIITKGCHHNAFLMKRVNKKAIFFDVNESLRKLRTRYIDVYLLHRDDPATPVQEIVDTLNQLYSEGAIRAFGGSNWTVARLEQANEYAYKHNLQGFTVSSPYYGLAEMKEGFFAYGLVSLAGKNREADRLWYTNNQMPVVAYSTLGSGLFSGKVENRRDLHPFWGKFAFGGKDNFIRLERAKEIARDKNCAIAQIAVAWSLYSAMNVHPIIGASKIKHLYEAAESLSITLSEEEYSYLAFIN